MPKDISQFISMTTNLFKTEMSKKIAVTSVTIVNHASVRFVQLLIEPYIALSMSYARTNDTIAKDSIKMAH